MAAPKEARVAKQQAAPRQIKPVESAGRRRSNEMEDAPPQEQAQFDCGPWAETPASSRVSRYRFDYLNRAIQVQWRNNKNEGYIYRDIPYEVYRSFARVASKGRYINSTLNGFDYDRLTTDELNAPSNENRRTVSRARG
jgi:KTSC domain